MAVVLPAPVAPMFAALAAEPQPADYNTLPAALDPASFRNWPASYQQSYVALHGAGVPPSVLIGTLGAGSLIATADGAGVAITNEPAEYGRTPASLSPITFSAWPEGYQRAYVGANQTGAPPSVMIGTLGVRSLIASVSGGTLTKTPEPSNIAALPERLSPTVFAGWPEVYRVAYVARHDASGTGKLLIGTLGSGSALATSAGGTVTLEPEPGLAGTAAAALARATFESWSADFRAVYVAAYQTGTPPGVIIGPLGGGSALATLSGGVAVLAAEPAGIGNAPALQTRAAFEAWPVAFQIAYVEARKTGQPPAVIIGTLGAGSVELRRSGNSVAITPEPAAITTAPTALEAATFFSWPKSYQAAYVEARQSGVPIGVRIGTPAGGTVFASVIGGALSLQPEPFGFNAAPADVSPALFADWPALYKAAYFDANKSGSPPTLLIGRVGQGSVLYDAALVATAEPAGAALAPNLVSPATFASWAFPFRMAYVEARGTGTPKALLLGEIGSGSQVQRVNGATLTFINEPAGAAALPAASSAANIAAWDIVFQRAYVAKHAVGNPRYVMVGNAEQNALSLSADGLTVTQSAKPATYVYDALTGKATPTATPESYLSWPNAYQQQYFADHGTGTPKTLAITSATGTTFTVTAAASGAIVIDALNFWETQFANPTFDPVIQETPGDAKDIPYLILPGSAAGIPSAQLRTDARDLFDIYDGDVNKLSAVLGIAIPPDFNTAPPTDPEAAKIFLGKFAAWHSAFQLEYIKARGITQNGTKVLNVPPHTGTAAPYPLLTAVVSIENPEKFSIVQNLQKADIARMDLRDQNAVAATTSFRYEIAAKLGYQPTSALTKFTEANGNDITQVGGVAVQNWTSTEWRAQLTDFVNDTVLGMQTKPLQNRSTDAAGNAISAMPNEFVSLFTDQLAHIVTQMAGMGIFSQDDIRKRVADIKERFDRAFAFYDVRGTTNVTYNIDTASEIWDGFPFSGPPDGWQKPPNWPAPPSSGWGFPPSAAAIEWAENLPSSTSVNMYSGVISRDDNQTINRGFEVFITQERKIRDLENARLSMAQSGELLNKAMDAPSLIYYFQYHYNLSVEAVIVIETEEVNQMNDLLKTYAEIQRIVSDTLKKYDGDAEQKKRLYGLGVNELWKVSENDRKIISMFEDSLGPSGQRHPLETIRKINRPGQDIINNSTSGNQQGDINEFLKTVWDTFASQLSETVTLLNQESQIKMNDINSMDKQKNRHYELANGALSKMFDMLSSIARAG